MNKNTIILMIFIIICISFLSIFSLSYAFIYQNNSNNIENNNIESDSNQMNILTATQEFTVDKLTNISINAIGDCTIGYDDNFGYSHSFNEVIEKNGYDYIFSNVKHIFENDDITIANLEGTFTDSEIKKEKAFNFKGPKDYVNILTSGSIDVVNIANNHIYDYNEIGYTDTINALEEAKVNYFGFDKYYIYEKENIKIGFAGIYCIEDYSCTKKIDDSIKSLKENNVNLIILSFHWGIEKSYVQSEIQKYLGHYAIDKGVELVLGHHPHVLEGIELYKDKYIVYSLGNFAFGGNKNPSDKDTMIFNINFKFKNKVLSDTIVNIYPTSISSVSNINDYRPTLLYDNEKSRVIDKIQKNSLGINLK